MMPIDEQEDEFELERGQGVVVPQPHPVFVRFCSMAVLAFVFLSFSTEYFQEMNAIAALKRSTPFTDACMDYTAESFSWFHRVLWHASGLQNIAERECWEQRRVASMLHYPNPLFVLTNLIFKSFVGTTPLADIFNRQSFFVQCIVIFSSAMVVGLLIYSFALKLPSFFTTLVQLPDLHRREEFEELQQRIREDALALPPQARAAYKRARDARKQKQRDWKLATYAFVMKQSKNNRAVA